MKTIFDEANANEILDHKIDIIGYIRVKESNPNGDIDDGNRPRMYSDNHGWISDVCLKHKIRDNVAMQHDDVDELLMSSKVCKHRHLPFTTTKKRVEAKSDIEKALKDGDTSLAEKQWFDVRAFGHVFTEVKSGAGSRGCVIVTPAESIDEVEVEEYTHTKEVPLENKKKDDDTTTKGSDTIGSSSYVRYGVYKFMCSINTYFAESNGFTCGDARKIVEAITKDMWESDEARARPEITNERVYCIEHDDKMGNVNRCVLSASVKTELQNPENFPEANKNEYVYDDSELTEMPNVHVRCWEKGKELVY